MNSYDLSRCFWDFAFENPEKIKPNHCAVYFFAIEHCNRLGWKTKFGFPTTMVMDAIGIKSYNTYLSTLNDLVDFGFIQMIEKSKNQYSSNIIAILKFDKALDKALDKAFIKHDTKQSESTVQSIDSIDKQITNIQENNVISFDWFWETYNKKVDRTKCESKFKKLTIYQKNKIRDNLPNYIKANHDIQYRKNPLTWLNGQCWNDEIIKINSQDQILTDKSIDEFDWDNVGLGSVLPNGSIITPDVVHIHKSTGLSYRKLSGL